VAPEGLDEDTELVEPIELSDDPADGMISDLQSVGAASGKGGHE
jgi:hypothetical protein